MVKDLKGYREKTDKSPRAPGWFILVISHVAILIVGISLGYWIGERFARVPVDHKIVSREVGPDRDAPAESIAREEETVPKQAIGKDGIGKGHLASPAPPEEKPRFTFYESLPRETGPATETQTERGRTKKKGPSKETRSTIPGITTRTKEPARGSTSSVYYVQVASFQEEERAGKLRDHLMGKGYSAEVVSVVLMKKGIWHRVRIGPFGSKTQANEKARAITKGEKLQPLIVSEKREKSP